MAAFTESANICILIWIANPASRAAKQQENITSDPNLFN